MTARLRADRLLVERGLFSSRAKAQAAIAAGLVTANAALVRKASDEIPVDAQLCARPAHPWVSRAGVKLAAALDHFRIDPRGCVCLAAGRARVCAEVVDLVALLGWKLDGVLPSPVLGREGNREFLLGARRD